MREPVLLRLEGASVAWFMRVEFPQAQHFGEGAAVTKPKQRPVHAIVPFFDRSCNVLELLRVISKQTERIDVEDKMIIDVPDLLGALAILIVDDQRIENDVASCSHISRMMHTESRKFIPKLSISMSQQVMSSLRSSVFL